MLTKIEKNISAEDTRNIFGEYDRYLKKIESSFHIDITERNGLLVMAGEEENLERASRVVDSLAEMSSANGDLSEQQVDYVLSLGREGAGRERDAVDLDRDIIVRTYLGRPIKPKTLGQKAYVDLIRSRMITFATGPAGTGKTFLGMALAIKALRDGEVQRLILTRPAIEAGEKLGFLPGDLQQKIDPYLRPLYDALYTIMGAESFSAHQERGLIEVAPLAYMRGRTLDSSFIILDEAQNTTPQQMKMFLTRIGFGSRVIVTGDSTQKDLERGQVSGLEAAGRILSGIDEIGFIELHSTDVVRHPLVQKIVRAYEAYEEKHR